MDRTLQGVSVAVTEWTAIIIYGLAGIYGGFMLNFNLEVYDLVRGDKLPGDQTERYMRKI